jgi:transcription elongation factor Elf1
MGRKKKEQPEEPKPVDTRTTYARYKCPDCPYTCSGYVEENDFKTRHCKTCGQPMIEEFRGRI